MWVQGYLDKGNGGTVVGLCQGRKRSQGKVQARQLQPSPATRVKGQEVARQNRRCSKITENSETAGVPIQCRGLTPSYWTAVAPRVLTVAHLFGRSQKVALCSHQPAADSTDVRPYRHTGVTTCCCVPSLGSVRKCRARSRDLWLLSEPEDLWRSCLILPHLQG